MFVWSPSITFLNPSPVSRSKIKDRVGSAVTPKFKISRCLDQVLWELRVVTVLIVLIIC